mgnify:CR=1 FL=1
MYCANCGAEIAKEAYICPKCGTKTNNNENNYVFDMLVKDEKCDIKTQAYDTEKKGNVLIYVNDFQTGMGAKRVIKKVIK